MGTRRLVLMSMAAVLACAASVYAAGGPVDLRPASPVLAGDDSDGVKSAAISSEALEAMNAGEWHGSGITGNGRRVGIICDGFWGYERLAGGELPPAELIHARTFGGSVSWPEMTYGTALAEIVADVAPESELFLAACTTRSDLEEAVEWFHGEGVDVVLTTLWIRYSGPGDGTGWYQELIRDSVAQYGTLWVVPAGDVRRGHWQGSSFEFDGDGEVNLPGEDVGLMFTNCAGDPRYFPAGAEIGADLVWNDWGVFFQRPFRLVLSRVDPNTGAVTRTLEYDRLAEDHAPYLNWTGTVDETGLYGLDILLPENPAATAHFLELFSGIPGVCFDAPTESGSLEQPADAADALAVAAVSPDWRYSLEPYSSCGPTNGPGGIVADGSVKPDIAGYAPVSTVTTSPMHVGGTAVAAAHVAGAAALVWSAYPELASVEVRSFLQDHAVDLGPDGKDVDTGFGRLSLGGPPASSCELTLLPDAATFGPAEGVGAVTVQTTDHCTWTAVSDAAWLHITSGADGTGGGEVSYRVDALEGVSQRTGTLTIGGETHTVHQVGGGCVHSLSSSVARFGATGGVGSVDVSAPSDCQWSAASEATWVDITGGQSGTGYGRVWYAVETYGGTGTRVGTLSIGGMTHTVIQERTGSELACTPGSTELCLLEGRFTVEVYWSSQYDGSNGRGRVVPFTDTTGFFWFFGEDNIELLVKVLDGTDFNGRFWVFYGALSDVEYWIHVTDTVTGASQTYYNEPGTFCGVGDTGAFEPKMHLAPLPGGASGDAQGTENHAAVDDAPATTCGNAFYDSGVSVGADSRIVIFPRLFGVVFRLADFGLTPGRTELTGLCVGNGIDAGGPWESRVYFHPDDGGTPSGVVTLLGQISTGDGSGPVELDLDLPISLDGDFWIVNRFGRKSIPAYQYFMEHDGGPGTGNSFNFMNDVEDPWQAVSSDYPDGLNYVLRATLRDLDQEPPAAEFTWQPQAPVLGETVTFTDLSSGDPHTWQWDFGDGSSSSEQNPTYVFTEEGDYPVSLEVASWGGSETITEVISVRWPSVGAWFEWTPAAPEVGEAVIFEDLSTGDPVDWSWDFDDGFVSSDRNPVHVFTTAGDHTVELTVSNGGGAGTTTRAVRVRPQGGGCVDEGETLRLRDGRFEVSVEWRDQYHDREGVGRTCRLTDRAGVFWFFNPASLDLVVKVLDGRPVNGHFWVLYGSLSDVEHWLHVRDTLTGEVRTYYNEPGQICGSADTAAF